MFLRLVSLTLVVSLAECSGPAPAPPAERPCQRIGDRCRLPEGPMGVCNETLGADCESPPCLACISQH